MFFFETRDYGLIGNRWNNTLDTYNMAVLLQVPIFDGGQREGRIAESRSQLRQEAIARIGLQAATKELELAKERYTVITTASHFELTNGLSFCCGTGQREPRQCPFPAERCACQSCPINRESEQAELIIHILFAQSYSPVTS